MFQRTRNTSYVGAIALSILFAMLCACTETPLVVSSLNDPAAVSLQDECRRVVDGLNDLKGNLGLPEHYQEENPRRQQFYFDPMQYFEVFDRLEMNPGYILDYVYHSDGMGGMPVLYARKLDDAPFTSADELVQSFGDDTKGGGLKYLEKIQLDQSPESYFQFYQLVMTGSQFYLWWHANYNDSQLVCDASDLERITEEIAAWEIIDPPDFPRSLYKADLAPAVLIAEGSVKIRYLAFTKWGGLIEFYCEVDPEQPQQLWNQQTKPLFEYDCGIMF